MTDLMTTKGNVQRSNKIMTDLLGHSNIFATLSLSLSLSLSQALA